MIQKCLDTVLPPRCPVTGEYVDYQGMLSGDAWRGLNFIASPYCKCCGMPFSFNRQDEDEETENPEEGDGMCMRCIEKTPPYNSARAALIYDDTSRYLILGFKHGDKTHLACNFAPWMQNAGREFLLKTDLLIPVPLHPSRLLSRRYNQSAILAMELAKVTDIKALPGALTRTRATPPQGHMSTKERQKNVRKAFALKEKYKSEIRNKTIVLIDDVYTTGATVNECTKALKSGGAKEVHILTLARVLKSEY